MWNNNNQCLASIHRPPRDTAGLVPDHSNKANITVKQVMQIFRFPNAHKYLFTLYCSLLSVQQYYVLKKKQCTSLNLKKKLLLKNISHFWSLQ